ncbi:MAG: Co(2+)/Mg(2+) efflux protein ApaG [Luteolibacter sp.]|jgi:ApaG protein
MEGAIQEFDGLRVHIDEVIHMPGLDAPGDKPHPFVYFITIHNDSSVSVTLKARKWVVREAGGDVTVVEGDGIVGQRPTLEPGGNFAYNSYHVVATDAEVRGAFFGTTAAGERIFVRIPSFRLEVPA